MKRLLVSGFFGLGDTLYQRPIVRALVDTYPDRQVTLSTAYPQFYYDISGLEFWYRPTILRSASEHMQTEPKYIWQQVHKRTPPDLGLSYNHKQFARGLNVIQGIEEAAGLIVKDASLLLTPKPEWLEGLHKITGGRKYVIVRCPTTRAEWNCISRNPQPGILPKLVEEIHKAGLMTISVGNNTKNQEIVTENLKCDKHLDSGQMSVYQVFGLFVEATAVLTCQGFAIPMSLASDTPSFTVYGGYVGPELLYDSRIGVKNHRWVAPDPFCNCLKMDHNCNKELNLASTISDFRDFITFAMGQRSGGGILSSRRMVERSPDGESLRGELLREVCEVRDDGSRSGSDKTKMEDGPEILGRASNGHRSGIGTVSIHGSTGDGVGRESDGDSTPGVVRAVT